MTALAHAYATTQAFCLPQTVKIPVKSRKPRQKYRAFTRVIYGTMNVYCQPAAQNRLSTTKLSNVLALTLIKKLVVQSVRLQHSALILQPFTTPQASSVILCQPVLQVRSTTWSLRSASSLKRKSIVTTRFSIGTTSAYFPLAETVRPSTTNCSCASVLTRRCRSTPRAGSVSLTTKTLRFPVSRPNLDRTTSVLSVPKDRPSALTSSSACVMSHRPGACLMRAAARKLIKSMTLRRACAKRWKSLAKNRCTGRTTSVFCRLIVPRVRISTINSASVLTEMRQPEGKRT